MESKFSVNVFENFIIYFVRLSSFFDKNVQEMVFQSPQLKCSENDTDSSFYFILLQQAKSRGVSTSVVGLVFATYPLLGFIFAPICGLMVSSFMLFLKIERSTKELLFHKA